jgi:hypothetical protein
MFNIVDHRQLIPRKLHKFDFQNICKSARMTVCNRIGMTGKQVKTSATPLWGKLASGMLNNSAGGYFTLEFQYPESSVENKTFSTNKSNKQGF